MKNIKLTVILILTALAAIFIVQNAAVVEVQFLVWSVQVSRALLMLLLLIVGFVAGWLLNSLTRYRQDRDKKSAAQPPAGGK